MRAISHTNVAKRALGTGWGPQRVIHSLQAGAIPDLLGVGQEVNVLNGSRWTVRVPQFMGRSYGDGFLGRYNWGDDGMWKWYRVERSP